MRRSLPLILFLCLPAAAGSFGSSAKGTTTAGFLKLGVGARAVAMGEAYSAAADEATALYWNPAALTRVRHRSATFMHAAYIDSSFFDYGAFAQNLGARGAWGAGLQYFSAGSITQTDQSGAQTGAFTPHDLALSAGYAYRMGPDSPLDALEGWSAGLSAKFIRSTILDSAQTAAADIGVLSPSLLSERLRLAFTAANIGGSMKFEQEPESLPLAFRLGSTYRIRDGFRAAFDLGLPRDNAPYIAMGTEYLLPAMNGWELAGRAGFNSRTIGDISGFTGFSFGFGLGYGSYVFDYVFVPFGSLGLAHRMSFSVRWGGTPVRASRTLRERAPEQVPPPKVREYLRPASGPLPVERSAPRPPDFYDD